MTKIDFITSAVFITDVIYYAAGYGINFYSDYSSTSIPLNNGKNHGLVYNSDISLTSCYTMPPLIASTPTSMTIMSINSLIWWPLIYVSF